MKPDYRADIDGLRGIAVLAVLLYHADFVWFSGGFVGVDVFFVISGYLITSIILREVQALDFSVLRFYERRVRRIFPALFVTLAITFVGGAFLLSPRNFKTLGDNAVAVTLFFSNIRFWNQSGYFDAPAEENPLLHTWSLAVEEQFYILFPLLLVGIRRFLGSRFALCLSIAGLGSLLICIYGTWHHPGATFYWAPTRAWELFLGGVLACNALPLPTNLVFRNAVAASGLALVLSGIFLLTSDTPFPGVAALLPTIGTALVIYTGAGEPTAIGRLVSSKPLVFIGLISYSLYLFHWPLIVFARRFSILALTSRQTVVLLLITAVLSALSWRFVERPFRSRQAIGRTPLFALAGAAMVATVSVGVFINGADGFPQRFGGVLALDDPLFDSGWKEWSRCENRPSKSAPEPCTVGAANVKPTFLIWGDSHTQVLGIAVSRSAARHSVAGYIATEVRCPPLLGIERPRRHECMEFNEAVLDYIDRRPELQTIILAARWTISADGRRYKTEEGPAVELVDIWEPGRGKTDNSRLFDVGLRRTVQRLHDMHRNVVLVEQIPEIGYSVPAAYAIASGTGRDVNRIIAPTREEYDVRNRVVQTTFRALREAHKVRIVEISKKMCDLGSCRVVDSGRLLYRDDNHLSSYGSQYVSPVFDELFANTHLPEKAH